MATRTSTRPSLTIILLERSLQKSDWFLGQRDYPLEVERYAVVTSIDDRECELGLTLFCHHRILRLDSYSGPPKAVSTVLRVLARRLNVRAIVAPAGKYPHYDKTKFRSLGNGFVIWPIGS